MVRVNIAGNIAVNTLKSRLPSASHTVPTCTVWDFLTDKIHIMDIVIRAACRQFSYFQLQTCSWMVFLRSFFGFKVILVSATTRVFAKQQLEAPCLWLAPMGMDIFPPLLAWFLLSSSKCYISPCCTNIKDEFSKEDWPALVIATWYFFNSWCNFSKMKDAFSWAIRFSTSEYCWSKQKWNSSITQVHGCNVPMQLNVIKLLQACSNILIWVAMAFWAFWSLQFM